MNESAPHACVEPLRVVLPGEDEVDEVLLNQAVHDLNAMYTVKGLETALQVGDYVLRTFFDGKAEAFRDRGRKHVTFRGLSAREDLELSYSFIWYAVSIVDQLPMLPEDVAQALPLSHHRLLLPVRNPRTKVRLAKIARDRKLSKRRFEELIRAERSRRPRRSKGGRPPLPAFVKGLNRLEKAVEMATEEEINPDSFSHYSTDDAKRLLANLYEQLATLDQLAERLRYQLAEMDRRSAENKPTRRLRRAAK